MNNLIKKEKNRNMNSTGKNIWNVIWYLVVFIMIQFVVTYAVICVWLMSRGFTFEATLKYIASGNIANESTMMIIISAVSSVLAIALFAWRRYAPISRNYLASHPWTVLIWVVLLALGTIIPSEWIDEKVGLALPDAMTKMFAGIMSERWGYLAIGILAPLAEEIVFRGAILRTLLKIFDKRLHWLPIIISALLFGLVHGNLAQFSHAFVIGLLLGWMYYRTDSIVPGIVLHWVNNTAAFVVYNLMPAAEDAKLIDIFGGNERAVWLSLGFSLCILLPALFQLSFRLKK